MVMHQNQTVSPQSHCRSTLWTAVNLMSLSMDVTSILNHFRVDQIELNSSLSHGRHRLTIYRGTDFELPVQLIREV
ncbi:MAG: hypothetical protein AAFR18_18690 [Cyanobacteria bacterium J06627_32]